MAHGYKRVNLGEEATKPSIQENTIMIIIISYFT